MNGLHSSTRKTFCVLPWIHSFVNLGGEYQVCCTSEEFDNNIVGDSGKKLNIADSPTLEEVMNSKWMKALRVRMLNGQWDKLCGRCQITEANGGHSRRIIENKKYQHLLDKVIGQTENDGTIHNEIIYADYRLGNLCNLQCRMCNPRSTYLWIREWNEIRPKRDGFTKKALNDFKLYNWFNSQCFANDLESKLSKLEHLHFAGGEPLIVPKMREVLEMCVEANVAKNIVLTYNTNITKLPPKVIELWKKFKDVRLLASIDAIGELNSYIRYPSKWNVIDKNLKQLDQHHKEMNVGEVLLSTTVQILNILHLDKIYEYLDQFNFVKKAPNLVNLHVPVYFQSTLLPPPLKQMAMRKLLNVIPSLKGKLLPSDMYLSDNIKQIIAFMNMPGHPQRFEEFFVFQEKFDRTRNIKLFDVFPELEQFRKPGRVPGPDTHQNTLHV